MQKKRGFHLSPLQWKLNESIVTLRSVWIIALQKLHRMWTVPTLVKHRVLSLVWVYAVRKVPFHEILEMTRLMTKPTEWIMRPAKTQISLGIRPVWSESSLSAWRKLGSLATHWAHNEDSDHWASEDSDQPGHPPRLIGVFAGRTVILLVLSWGGSYHWVSKINDFSFLRALHFKS